MNKHKGHQWYWRKRSDLAPGESAWGLPEYNLVLWCYDCKEWIVLD